MVKNDVLKKEAIFDRFIVSGKTGDKFVKLSDGMDATLFKTGLSKEDFAGFTSRDKMLVGFDVNPFNSFETIVVSVEKI